MSRQNLYIAKEIRDLVHQMIEPKITSFFNLEILLPFYSELNGAWRADRKINLVIGKRRAFWKRMGELVDLIME